MHNETRRSSIAYAALAVLCLAVSTLPAAAGEPQRMPPPIELAPGDGCLQAPVTISGTVELQTEEEFDDVVVTLVDSSGKVQSAITNPRGEFRFAEVCPGRYLIKADVLFFSPHLAAAAFECEIPAGGAVLPTVTLSTGDINDDRAVNDDDLDLIKRFWGTECPFPNPPFPDLNGDCEVNVLDATLAGANYGKKEPAEWGCPGEPTDG